MYYQDLEAYKLSMDFVVEIYELTKAFPKTEDFGLTSQMRRCAVSIPSNIAEGCARYSDKETSRFINIALGSIAEIETQVIISQRLGYLTNIDDLLGKLKKLMRWLSG